MIKFKTVFSLCLLTSGAVLLVMPRGYSVGFFLFSLMGLALWSRTRDKLVDASNQWLILPCLVYAVGEVAIGLTHHWGLRMLDPYVPFVLLMFAVLVLRKYKPNPLYFWCGLAVGAVGAALISGYQSMVLGQRSDGFTHAIQFGNAALLIGVLCFVRLLTVRSSKWVNVLMALGFVSGLAASVWSQTRGGWLAVFLIFIWLLATATHAWPKAKRLGAAAALLCVLGIPALQPNGIVQNRVMSAAHELEVYLETHAQASSVGARLAMWEFASKDIAQAPWLGHGVLGWMRSRDEGVALGALDPFIKDFTHLHNEFLDVAYKNGLVGLALLLGLYILPMLMFFKPYLHGYSSEVKALAIGGMVLPMMYMDFGLTQTFLSHNSGRMVFVNLLMCLGSLLLNEIEKEQPCFQ